MNRYAVAFALSLCCVQAAYAEAYTTSSADSGDWRWQVTPYLWAAGIKGQVSPFRHSPTLDVDKSFSDVMHDFNIGGFINVWGRRDRLVLSSDLMYVSTTDSHGKGPLSAFQIPGLGVVIPAGASIRAKVDSKQFMATFQGGYRVVDTGQATLDVLGGLRFWQIATDVSVTVGHPAIGVRSASHDERFTWVDPLLGMRAFVPVGDALSLQMQADVGGFGVGSKRTWSALATANYVFTDSLSTSLGYKLLDVHYDRSGHVYDVRTSGPVLGLTYRF